MTGFLKVLVVVCVFVGAGALLYFAKRYVTSVKPIEIGSVELVDVPGWVSVELKAKILGATGGKTFRLNEESARLVAENLATSAWLDEAQVQITHDSIRIKGRWRKPLAVVKSSLHRFYVDAELVVLDFVPMPHLPIAKVKGLPPSTQKPLPGTIWQRDDLAAAVAVLVRLDRMDKLVSPDKPLLYEIDNINVSNFNGRENDRFPHIVLYAKDNTEIIWGAEIGAWQRYLEATDEEKLAKLYGYYKEHGSLLDGAKYIKLCDPQDKIPLPIDKY